MSLLALECALTCRLLVPVQPEPVPVQQTTNSVLFYPKEVKVNEVLIQAGAAASPRPAVDEEIAVMRSLLIRKLAAATGRGSLLNYYRARIDAPNQYSDSRATTAAPYWDFYDGSYLTTDPFSGWALTRLADGGSISVEGIHLDGYGVLFTVTMPAAASQNPRPIQAPSPPAPLSDWEQARRGLRGEPEPPAATPKEPSLGDVLLHLLAENGKHFTHLRDDERLTVVVTFRGQRADATPQANLIGAQPATANQLTKYANDYLATVDSSTVPSGGQSARDLELLIDLHLKQGQTDQALAAIEKALKQADDGYKKETDNLIHNLGIGSNHPSVIAATRKWNMLIGSLYAKKASVLVAAGKLDEAREALEKAQRMRQEMTGSQQTPAPSAAPAKPGGPVLPAKLTVSATKSQLDLVGSGKMTFEEFRKVAKVEFYPATGAEKPAPPREKK